MPEGSIYVTDCVRCGAEIRTPDVETSCRNCGLLIRIEWQWAGEVQSGNSGE